MKTWFYVALAILLTSPLWTAVAWAEPTLHTGGI